jgi:hypothetical protein
MNDRKSLPHEMSGLLGRRFNASGEFRQIALLDDASLSSGAHSLDPLAPRNDEKRE